MGDMQGASKLTEGALTSDLALSLAAGSPSPVGPISERETEGGEEDREGEREGRGEEDGNEYNDIERGCGGESEGGEWGGGMISETTIIYMQLLTHIHMYTRSQ